MKASTEKSSTTTSTPASRTASQPFFAKAGGGNFFEPATGAPSVQMKMTVNQPGDKFEQEADRMADKIMRMPAPTAPNERLQRQPDDKLQKKEDDKIQKAAAPEEKLQRAEKTDEKLQKKEDDKLQREGGTGTPAVGAGVQAAIRQKTTGGQPLSADVRGYMEPRFGADFSNVRIHNDPDAARLSNQLSARAFTYQNHVFFSRDQYQPGTGEGKQLLAHELTHTIQQGHAIQRSPQVSTTATPPPIQRWGMQDALDYFAEEAYHIPGFRLLTIVLGFNPINRQSTDRSAANILRALIEVIPGGHLITQALDNHGVFNKAGAWVEQKIAAFADIGGEIISGLKRFLDSLKWRDILSLGSVWERAKAIFTGPIGRLIAFGGSVVGELLKLVKDAILKPLAALAEGTAGYDLLKAVLGEDPITGEPVPQSADALIGGFMKLIGQEEIYNNLKKGNALAKAYAWFQSALSGLMGFVRAIPGRIVQTITSLTFQDIVTVAGAFTKVVSSFASIAGNFLSWGLQQVISLLEILFSVVAPGVMPYLKKAQAAFQTILKNPIGFVGNLVAAGKLGFQLFAANIGKHLKTALIKWITGPLGDAGVYIPQSFTLLEIVKLALSVLGLTWQNIRGKLVKIIPEPVLVGLEKTAGVLVTLVKDGPAAAWEQIKGELSELKDQLIAQVTQMVTSEVVKAAVGKLASMLNPAGAVIQAIIAIYNTVTFFIEKSSQIGKVVASFIDSISAIAAGQVAGAAKKVEATMANTLNIVLAFLAKFAGLGGIPNKLVGIVKRIRKPIDKGMDKIVAWLGELLKKAGSFIKDKVGGFFKPKSFSAGGEAHRLYVDPAGNVTLASNPKRLQNALNDLRGTLPAGSPALAKIAQADSKGGLLQTKTTQLKAATAEPDIIRLTTETETLSSEIVALLVDVMYNTGAAKKATMALTTITFTAKGNKAEYDRQIGMQKSTINGMMVGDWQKNRARFTAFGRDKKNDTDSGRRQAMIDKLVANPVAAVKALSADNLLTASDQSQINMILADPKITDKNKAIEPFARVIMNKYGNQKLAVLHTVDQVAGGRADVYGDSASIFGSTEVNSDIGGQWYRSIGAVDSAAKDVEPAAKMNLDLKVV
jgi:hypothetical protein